MLQSDRFWPELVEAIGHPELATDPRFVDAAARAANKEECIARLDEIFGSRTYAEWTAALADIEGQRDRIFGASGVLLAGATPVGAGRADRHLGHGT